MSLTRASLRRFAEARRGAFEETLARMVAIPSVSADPGRRRDLHRITQLACSLIRSRSGRARIHRLPGAPPLVLGEWRTGRALPWITFYNHLDVQPAEGASEGWRTAPFVLARHGQRYHGRGATDDKGPALAALMGIEAALASSIPANLRVIWESGEEIGSPGLEGFLRTHRASLDSACVVISDTVWLRKGVPSYPVALRGFQGFRFSLETAKSDRHSGDVGGAARNPVAELMDLMVQLHDPHTGEVKVPGFYEGVASLARRDLAGFVRAGFSISRFRREQELLSLRVGDEEEVLRRIWAQPTFEIHGVSGGYSGEGIKAIVPGRAEVKASCRLVAGQDPAKIFRLVRSHASRLNPDVRVDDAGASRVFEGAPRGPFADALVEGLRFGFGRRPLPIRDGGSIGAALALEKELRCPVLFLGISLPEDGYHAPNESIHWRQVEGGLAAFARFIELAADIREGRASGQPPVRTKRVSGRGRRAGGSRAAPPPATRPTRGAATPRARRAEPTRR